MLFGAFYTWTALTMSIFLSLEIRSNHIDGAGEYFPFLIPFEIWVENFENLANLMAKEVSGTKSTMLWATWPWCFHIRFTRVSIV